MNGKRARIIQEKVATLERRRMRKLMAAPFKERFVFAMKLIFRKGK